jgi:hypothetical protein
MLSAAILGLEPAEATLLAALVAATVGLLLHYGKQRAEAADRRRTLHGEAYQAVLEWCEGVWRVRRRPKDGSGDDELVKHFHAMQEKLAYYEGWLALEDPCLGRAFRIFVDGVLAECRPLIQTAWKDAGRHPSEEAPPGERSPQLLDLKQKFLEDTRDLVSRRPWLRVQARRRLSTAAAAKPLDRAAPRAAGQSPPQSSADTHTPSPGGAP